MNLGTRLARLERRATLVLRCAWCRYSLVNVDDGGGRGKTEARPREALVWKTCRWCGNRYRQLLPDFSSRELEALLLWYHTFDGETYRDERAYAAQRWWSFRWQKQALEEADEAEVRPAANPAYRGNYGRGKVEKVKEPRAVRERRELKEAATAQLRKARAREERLYGPRAFSLEETLKGLQGDCHRYAHLYDEEEGYRARSAAEIKARQLLAYARCMEACELVLWGEAEAEAARALETLPAEIERLAEAGRAEKREKEERERRERAERERERLARLGLSSPPTPERLADVTPSASVEPRRQYAPTPDPEGRPLIQIPEIPPPPGPEERARATQAHPFWKQESEPDVSRLPDRLKYREPRWEGDTDY